MKILALFAAVFVLNSCNTGIGMYRDCVQAVNWTKSKFDDGGGGGAGEYEDYGAPIY
jgi:predicted small secreted protein